MSKYAHTQKENRLTFPSYWSLKSVSEKRGKVRLEFKCTVCQIYRRFKHWSWSRSGSSLGTLVSTWSKLSEEKKIAVMTLKLFRGTGFLYWSRYHKKRNMLTGSSFMLWFKGHLYRTRIHQRSHWRKCKILKVELTCVIKRVNFKSV